jgi:hypothetical protein
VNQVKTYVILILLFFSGAHCFAVTFAQVPYGLKDGYTDNVDDEYESESQEIILIEKPTGLDKPSLHDQIFNAELTKEFRERYRSTFGRTEEEENYFLTSKQGYYQSPSGLSATQLDTQRRDFAEYMLRRLAEYHTENVMKNEPALKKVYEVKQAVSNYQVNVGPSARLDMRYSFVGNYFDGMYTSPLINTKLTINMDPSAFTPSAPREVYCGLSKNLTPNFAADANYSVYDKGVRLSFTKMITSNVSTNFSESVHIAGTNIDATREELSLLGLTVVF